MRFGVTSLLQVIAFCAVCVALWSASRQNRVPVPAFHALTFSADGGALIAARQTAPPERGTLIESWTLGTGKYEARVAIADGVTGYVALSSGSPVWASLGADGKVVFGDLDSGVRTHSRESHASERLVHPREDSKGGSHVCLSANGATCASRLGGEIIVWDVPSAAVLCRINTGDSILQVATSMALSDDGSTLGVSTRRGHYLVDEMRGGQCRIREYVENEWPHYEHLAFDRSSQQLAAASGAGSFVRIIDVAEPGKQNRYLFLERPWEFGSSPSAACFSPDGRVVYVSTSHGRVVGWSVSGDLTGPTFLEEAKLRSEELREAFFDAPICVSPDGTRIATAVAQAPQTSSRAPLAPRILDAQTGRSVQLAYPAGRSGMWLIWTGAILWLWWVIRTRVVAARGDAVTG